MNSSPNKQVENTRIAGMQVLTPPTQLKESLPASPAILEHVLRSRRALRSILDRQDHRLFVVVGPCSIHNRDGALDYARRLAALATELDDTLLLVMRVYFEKPRTTTGWKGLINDPQLNDSFAVEEGLKLSRQLLLDINALGLPTGTEALDPIIPQYLQDLISWTAIGARTTESQTHREMASGLSTPVGFKNNTEGNIDVVLNALQSAREPHSFLGIDETGRVNVVHTEGNPYGHAVLRGGKQSPNYQAEQIAAIERSLVAADEKPNIVIDCSHANSGKQFARQPEVLDDVCRQIEDGNRSIVGLMLESNLHEGRQDIPADLSQLRYGVSVTDACIDWETTETILRDMRGRLRDRLTQRPVAA